MARSQHPIAPPHADQPGQPAGHLVLYQYRNAAQGDNPENIPLPLFVGQPQGEFILPQPKRTSDLLSPTILLAILATSSATAPSPLMTRSCRSQFRPARDENFQAHSQLHWQFASHVPCWSAQRCGQPPEQLWSGCMRWNSASSAFGFQSVEMQPVQNRSPSPEPSPDLLEC